MQLDFLPRDQVPVTLDAPPCLLKLSNPSAGVEGFISHGFPVAFDPFDDDPPPGVALNYLQRFLVRTGIMLDDMSPIPRDIGAFRGARVYGEDHIGHHVVCSVPVIRQALGSPRRTTPFITSSGRRRL